MAASEEPEVDAADTATVEDKTEETGAAEAAVAALGSASAAEVAALDCCLTSTLMVQLRRSAVRTGT